MAVPRTYHSVALLLPDARVFSGGGGLCGTCPTNHFDGQTFTPPYLLNADGSPRSRPTITAAPATAAAGSNITLTTDRAVTAFSLVRMGSATHTVDTDQRRVPLTIGGVTGTTATVAIPADRGVVVPGYYMLFALDAAGVPSVAKLVKIS
jgi:galactose oxidase